MCTVYVHTLNTAVSPMPSIRIGLSTLRSGSGHERRKSTSRYPVDDFGKTSVGISRELQNMWTEVEVSVLSVGFRVR